MKRQPFYPKNQGDQSEWHTNLATKLPGYAATLPLTQAEEDAAVADNLILAYSLGDWIISVRESPPSWTAALETLATGNGNANFVFPTLQVPPLPALPNGITGVKPGALRRTFDLAQTIKRKPGYTTAIGLDLGIVGPEAPPPPPGGDVPPPRITVKAVPGTTYQKARCQFYKDGHEYVAFQCRRGTGDWEDIGMSDKSPHFDDRPLLVAGQAEIREYRGRFFDHGAPSSDWCDVAKVTISP